MILLRKMHKAKVQAITKTRNNMLTATAKAKLVSTLKGFDIEKLIASITETAEVEFEVPEVSVLTATELETRDTTMKGDGEKDGFKKGKTAGLEITGKALIKKLNLPETVKADSPDEIFDAIQKANTSGDAGLKEQVRLLQLDNDKIKLEKETVIKEKEALSFDTELMSSFPQNRIPGLSDAEYLNIVKMNYQFEKVDGKNVVKKNGEVLRDPSTQSPIAPKDALTTFFTERKWIGEEANGGRGGGDNGGGTGGMTKMSQVATAYVKANPGKQAMGEEFQAYLDPIAAKTTDFDFYN